MLHDDDVHALVEARHPDPFAVLGMHAEADGALCVRALLPRVRACDSWSVGQAPAALGKAVVSDVPTLLLSGALDLQTYPEWGDQAAKTLSHAKHVVIPHATHSTISVPCAAQLMTSFLVAGSVQGLDTSCVGAISAPAW